MADDKLKTSPESPGQDRPGDTPVEDAPSMQEPPAPETAAPEKAAEHTEPEQSMIPGMGEGAPARPAPGEVVVDFDKINELMSQRRASARDAVSKTSPRPHLWTKCPEVRNPTRARKRVPVVRLLLNPLRR